MDLWKGMRHKEDTHNTTHQRCCISDCWFYSNCQVGESVTSSNDRDPWLACASVHRDMSGNRQHLKPCGCLRLHSVASLPVSQMTRSGHTFAAIILQACGEVCIGAQGTCGNLLPGSNGECRGRVKKKRNGTAYCMFVRTPCFEGTCVGNLP